MSKKCKDCGCIISSEYYDYCSDCLKLIEDTNKKANPIEFKEETTLTTIANIILLLGILAFVVMMFTNVFHETHNGLGERIREFNPSGLTDALTTLISSIVIWALFKCIASISKNIKIIASRLQKQ